MRVTFFYFLMLATLVTQLFAADFPVNSTASCDQTNPSIAMDAQGNFIVAWANCPQNGNSGGIFAQRFNQDCAPIGPEFQINSESSGDPNNPDIAMAPNGNFIIAWQETGIDQEDIFARKFDAAGNPFGSQFRVNSNTADKQILPAVAAAPDGNFVIVWQSRLAQPKIWDVYFQFYDTNGAPLGTEQKVNLFSNSLYPDVAMEYDNEFTITWMQSDSQHQYNQVMFRMYSANASPKADPNFVNATPFYFYTRPSISCADSGHFVVTWQAHPSSVALSDIYARCYSWKGSTKFNEFIVNTYTEGAQQNPKVAMNDQRDFIVVWNTDGDIHARRFRTSNDFLEPIGDEFTVNTYKFNDQKYPAAALKENAEFVAVWQSLGQDGSGDGIFAAAGPQIPCADFTDDLFVNFRDYCLLADHWLMHADSLIADLIDDNKIDYYDLAEFSNQWLTSCYDCASANLNNDSSVDLKDFALFAKNWLKQGPNLTGDTNTDGYVNATDLKIFLSHWLESCP